jgi:hypothetical protein
MKRPLLLILVFVTIAVSVLGIRYALKKNAKRNREASYQVALASYRQPLRPGMTRKEVEDYLRAKNIPFSQMCCVEDFSKHSWDDLTKIGAEDTPWFCGEYNVYVAFQFTDHKEQHERWWRGNNLDTLKSITIYNKLENCL